MNLDERVSLVERNLRKAKARIAALEANLRSASRADFERPEWAWTMTPQEWALVCALLDAYPRVLSDAALDHALPHHDHAAKRCATLIATVVSRVRRKMPGGIERVFGLGYRLSDQAVRSLKLHGSAPTNSNPK